MLFLDRFGMITEWFEKGLMCSDPKSRGLFSSRCALNNSISYNTIYFRFNPKFQFEPTRFRVGLNKSKFGMIHIKNSVYTNPNSDLFGLEIWFSLVWARVDSDQLGLKFWFGLIWNKVSDSIEMNRIDF